MAHEKYQPSNIVESGGIDTWRKNPKANSHLLGVIIDSSTGDYEIPKHERGTTKLDENILINRIEEIESLLKNFNQQRNVVEREIFSITIRHPHSGDTYNARRWFQDDLITSIFEPAYQAELSLLKRELSSLQRFTPPVHEQPTFFHSQEGGTGTLDIGVQPIITQPEPVPEPQPAPTPQPTPEPAPIEAPLVTEPEPVIIEQPIVTATPIITPTVDDSIKTGMVTQQVINFNIINGRAVGSIKFVATNSFNPYYYGKDIINLVQFKTPNGVTLLVKQNRLRFTQTERDEIINYDESVQENTRITVESFVWEWMDNPAGAFSNKYIIDISEAEPPKPMQAGFMGAGVAGAIAGLILLGFVADHKRAK